MKRLIGYGYTNSSGIATLDYDASGTAISPSGYSGSGKGLTDIQAEMHEDNTVHSSPIEITDALFYDKGLSGTGQHNDNWFNVQNRLKITRESDGTKLESLGEQWAQWYVINVQTDFDVPFAVEFDVVDYSDTPAIGFNNKTITTPQVVTTGHWKFVFKIDDILVFKDNQQVTSTLGNLIGGTSLKVFWELSHPTDTVKFKEFRIYQI